MPARTSTITFFSSFGSGSTIARRISSSSSDEPRLGGLEQLAQLGVVAVLGQHLARALRIRGAGAPLLRQLVRGLERAVFASDLGIALAVADHLGVGHLLRELGEAALYLLDELLDHA